MQVLVIGLSNGVLMRDRPRVHDVYGIIELINFAHGDLVMIGSVMTAIFLEERLGQTTSSRRGGSGASAVCWMDLCGLFNATIEKLAYRRFATRRSWRR